MPLSCVEPLALADTLGKSADRPKAHRRKTD
jgi:hypothetical protein